MQGKRCPADAALGQRVEQGLGEMETRCWSRHRTLGVGEDRLIIGAVARIATARALDIGRQRQRDVPRSRITECPYFEVKAQRPVAVGMLLGDLSGEILGEDEGV